MSFFNKRCEVRLTKDNKQKIIRLLNHNKDVFENESHVVRSAINYFYSHFDKKKLNEV